MISPLFQNKIGKSVTLRKVAAISVLVLGVFTLSTHFANAQAISSLLGFGSLWQTIAEVLAGLANVALSLTSWFVALSAMLLNVSINITMHIKEIVSSTPAIYDVWKAIRDLSGLVIIFTLLIASIQLILGVGSPNFGQMIKNVVIAGVLINFSFFATGVMIDASNMVSLTLYRAMLPGQPDIGKILDDSGHTVGGQALAQSQIVAALLNDGGISALFMQSLQIQSQFNPKNINMKDSAGGISAALKIVLIAITGIVIMITAGLSFLAAALAFIIRLVILIFLLAFSPIWFAAAVIPQLKSYANDWWGALKSQLFFMPVYLLLMYVALLILSKSSVFTNGAAGNLWKGGAAGAAVPTEFIVLAINSVFVIIMLNVPLVAAIKVGGMATKILDKMPIKAGNIWKGVGNTAYQGTKGAAGYAGVRTLGKWAFNKEKDFAKTSFGNSLIGRTIRSKTTGALAGSKMGSPGRSFKELDKENKDVNRGQRNINRRSDFDLALADATNPTRPPIPGALKDAMGKLSEKEKLSLGAETLMKPEVLLHLKGSEFEAIKKNEDDFTEVEQNQIAEARKTLIVDTARAGNADNMKTLLGNMTDDQKKALASTRKDALSAAVATGTLGGVDTVKALVNDMDAKELLKIEKDTPGTIDHVEVIPFLNTDQLKKMSENGLSQTSKQSIRLKIEASNQITPHSAMPFIVRNLADWTV